MNYLFERPYEEEFARQCIMYCYPELGWNLALNKKDPPDLIDLNKGIGVEVTGAKTKEDNELDSIYEKYKGCEENEIPDKLRKKIDKQVGKLLFFPDENGKLVLKACHHRAKTIDYHEVVNRIVAKTKRLNTNDYGLFKIDGVFINDSDSFFWGKSVPDILEEIESKTSNYERTFSLIFVFCYHDIYLIDIDSRKVIHKGIKDDEIQMIIMKSLNSLGRSIS